MKTLTTKGPKQKWLLPLERLYIGDKAPAYMYLAPNIWCQFKDPMQKRIILAPTIIMDVCYQDMLEYARRYKPKQKEKQLVNIIINACKAYHKKVFDIAPHLDELILDCMDGFEDVMKQQRMFMHNALYNLYSPIKEIPDDKKAKLIDLLLTAAFVNWSSSFASLHKQTETDKEILTVKHNMLELADLMCDVNFTIQPTKHSEEIYERCCTTFRTTLMDYITQIEC